MTTQNPKPSRHSKPLLYGVALLISIIFTFTATRSDVLASLLLEVTGLTEATSNSSLDHRFTEGLVGHWTMDGPDVDWGASTAEVKDVSGSGNDGDAKGSMTSRSAIPGILGQATRFNGTDDYINITSTLSLEPTDAFSVSAWVKVNDFSRRQGIVSRLSTVNWALIFQDQSNGRFQFFVNSAANQGYVSASNYPDKWWHVVGTYDSAIGKMRLYVDGVMEDEDDESGAISTTSDITIGRYYSAGTLYSDMDIDDVRIYNRALTADEVAGLYALGGHKINKTRTDRITNGLVGHWTFDGQDVDWSASTSEVKDVSGSGNNGDAQGNMTTRKSSVGKLGQALEFDGEDDKISIPYSGSVNLIDTTFSAWIYAQGTDTSETDAIIDHGTLDTPGNNKGFTLRLNTSNMVQWNVADGSGNRIELNGWSVGSVLNGWHHIAATHKANESIALYVDGNFVSSTPITGFTPDTQPISLGDVGSKVASFEGFIDDVRIYNRALTPAEINDLYLMGQ